MDLDGGRWNIEQNLHWFTSNRHLPPLSLSKYREKKIKIHAFFYRWKTADWIEEKFSLYNMPKWAENKTDTMHVAIAFPH